MRLEKPRAEAHFVKTKNTEAIKNTINTITISEIKKLWNIIEKLSSAPVEFKTENWILESQDEITEDHTMEKWVLIVRYRNLSNYTNIEFKDEVLSFYGSPTAEAHQLLAGLSDAITKEGYNKFTSYRSAIVATRASHNTKKRIGKQRKNTEGVEKFSSISNQRSVVNKEALYKAFLYTARLYRNMLAATLTIAAFTSLDLLKTMILGIIPTVITLGVLMYFWDINIRTKNPLS